MTAEKSSPRVRIKVASAQDFAQRFGPYLADGTLYIRHPKPLPLNARVKVLFESPEKGLLGQVLGKVVRCRPPIGDNDKTAGMEIEFVDYSANARAIAERYKKAVPKEEQKVVSEDLTQHEAAPDIEGPVVGIDLGTTNSCAAVVVSGKPVVCESDKGYETIPSIIYVSADRQVMVGPAAKEQMILHPGRTIYGSKRFIGRPFASTEVRRFGYFFNYSLEAGPTGLVSAQIDGKLIPLELVGAYILSQAKGFAERKLGVSVNRAVVTVPAYFGENQRHAVRESGRIAGLHVERIVSEPTAAAIAYGFGRGLQKTILVYDLGGGTFDASLLRLDGDKMDVLSTDGDPFLGGSDFDDRLIEYVLMSLERKTDINLRADAVLLQRVRMACEEAKKQLSDVETVNISIPHLAQGPSGPLNVDLKIERNTFEMLTDDLVTRTLDIVQKVLNEGGISSDDIDDVILVGGQSRAPNVRRRLVERFGEKLARSVHPDHAVALGAAILGSAAEQSLDVQLTDILGSSIRVGTAKGESRVVLQKGVSLPCSGDFEVKPANLGDKQAYVAKLCRGDALNFDENEFLGEFSLPASIALAISKTAVKVDMSVSEDGILSVSTTHPTTGAVHDLQVNLGGGSEEIEVLDIDDLELLDED